VSSSPFYRVGGEAGWLDGEGNRAADGGGIDAGHPVWWGGKQRGEWGVKRGKVRRHFWQRRGHRGSGSARGRWRQQPVGPLEEEDSQAVDRAGLPVSEGEAAVQAGTEGGGREPGRGLAERGRKRGGPRLDRKSKMAGFKK
jgi:hypothetical protein